MGTTNSNLLPNATGQDLGSTGQRWDAFLQDESVSGTSTVANVVATNVTATNLTATSATVATLAVTTETVGTETATAITTGTLAATSATVGNLSAKVANNIRWADQFAGATADIQINAAIADLPAAGGTVDCRGYGATVQIIANPLIIGSASQQVTLIIDRSTQFNVTVTGAVDAIQLWVESSIIALDMGNVLAVANFNVATTANIDNLIASYPRTGPSITNIRGITIRGSSLATVTGAMVDLVGVTDKSTVQEVVCYNFAGPGLRISNAAGGVPSGPINVTNCSFNGVAVAGAKPVQIVDVAAGGVMGGINFFGGSYTHPGAGGLVIFDIQGSASNNIDGVNLYGVQFESSNLADIGLKIVNATSVYGSGLLFTSNVNVGTTCISISASGGGVSYGIAFDNVSNHNAWTNTIVDSVNTVTLLGATTPRLGHYTALAPTVNAFMVAGTKPSVFNTPIAIDSVTPTGTGTQLSLGNTHGFGAGAAGTAVTTTTKGGGTGPTTPETVIGYLEIDIGGTKHWVPYCN